MLLNDGVDRQQLAGRQTAGDPSWRYFKKFNVSEDASGGKYI